MHYIETLLLLLFLTPLQAQLQIPVFPNLVGEDLIREVANEYKPFSVLNYGDARDLMYGNIYNENDSVSCVYTGHTLYLPLGVDPSTFLWMNGIAGGINAEHTYPRSKGANEENGNAFSDMHHLFPTRAAVNTARSNFPFGEINDSQTAAWYYGNQTQSNTPSTNIDLYSERINGRFEPREQHKGNAARAVFYFFTMYKEDALNADPDFFESQRAELCDWHSQDPVDFKEWERTYMIAAYQNDLPNPFVLDSTLVLRSFCGATTPIDELVESKTLVFPNPVMDWVNVTSEGENTMQTLDIIGRILKEEHFYNSIKLDFSGMNPGTYIILVNGKAHKIRKL